MKNYPIPCLKTFSLLFIFNFCLIFNHFSYGQPINFDWVKQISGQGTGYGAAITEDKDGNFIIAGSFGGSFDFDPGPDVHQLASSGQDNDTYVAKYASDGSFVWAFALIGQSLNEATDVVTDAEGNIYVTGYMKGLIDIDPSPEVYYQDAGNIFRNYILKYSPSGQILSARLTGRYGFMPRSHVNLSANGNIIISGIFSGEVDFDPGPGTVTHISNGDYDSYILSLDPVGNFIWVKIITGNQTEIINALTVDHNGDLVAAGGFVGHADFDPGPEEVSVTAIASPSNAFVLKLGMEGNFIWVSPFTGTGKSYASSVKTTKSGDVIVAASLGGTIDFDPGSEVFELTKEVSESMVLVNLSASGELVKAVQFGENDYFNWPVLALDTNANIYVSCGFTGSPDFDPGPESLIMTSTLVDLFYAVFDNSFNLLSAVQCPGQRLSACRAMIISANGDILSTGFFEYTVDFDPGSGVYPLTAPVGNTDIFILKLKSAVSSTKEFGGLPPITMYPNPTGSHLYVELPATGKQISVDVFDLSGRKISSQILPQNTAQTTHLIQTSSLKTGTYIIQLTTDRRISANKILISND